MSRENIEHGASIYITRNRRSQIVALETKRVSRHVASLDGFCQNEMLLPAARRCGSAESSPIIIGVMRQSGAYYPWHHRADGLPANACIACYTIYSFIIRTRSK